MVEITVPNMNNIHLFISEISLQTYKIYENIGINATLGNRANVYFMCIKLLLWLITVPNINKIHIYSFMKYHYKHITFVTKMGINTTFGTEPRYIYEHQASMVFDHCIYPI